MHDQVISLWKNFGLENDQAMLDNLKVPGESMGAFKLGPILKRQEVHQMQGGYSNKMRLEDMMEVILYHP